MSKKADSNTKVNSSKMKPSGTSTPLIVIQDAGFNISASMSPCRSSPSNFYDENKINSNELKPNILHNCTSGTTTTGTSSSINLNDCDDVAYDEDYHNDDDGDDEDDNDEIKNESIHTDDSDVDDDDDDDECRRNNNNNNNIQLFNLENQNKYHVLNAHPNLYYNSNIKMRDSNNLDYCDENNFRKATNELFLTKIKKLINDFVREYEKMNRERLAQKQSRPVNNKNKTDHIFADMKKIEKLKIYGNKIFVCRCYF